MKHLLILFLGVLCVSCQTQESNADKFKTNHLSSQEDEAQVAQYVVLVFQDSRRNLWFGTLEKGVAKYDGNELVYLTMKDGLPSNRITNIIEDSLGNLWFGTGAGLSKFDGKAFTNYTLKNDLNSNMISNLFVDSKGHFWVGTWGGVYIFNGTEFEKFPIPYPKIETPINEDTKNWITDIIEDHEGNIWFARDGYGAVNYDGKNVTHILKKDGLYSNNITKIEIDKQGHFWFGSRVAEKDNVDPEKRKGSGGVTKYDRKNYTYFSEIPGLNEADVYEIYRDHNNNIWISTVDFGVYRYNGNEFKSFDVPIAIMTIMEDDKGNMWLGGSGGLYRINVKGEVENIRIKESSKDIYKVVVKGLT